ncbi:MAG: PilZ domain-containing protein [Clostridiales bacterium]|jgi:c-di-GMP-binding flagellar brake protein YcgR|nr:PilZ domain-containing protein [Clostridiales bacterium]
MIIQQIKPGVKIEIMAQRDENIRVSQAERVLNGNEVLIHLPFDNGQPVFLPKNERYTLLFYTDAGILRYEGAVRDYTKENGADMLIVRFASRGEKIQRREFFRHVCLLPMKFITGKNGSKTVTEGVAKDIGGGGLRFDTNGEMNEGDPVKSALLLNDIYLIVAGVILQKRPLVKSQYAFEYRIQFTDILQQEQEKIVQYIFQEQRKMLQKARTRV